MAGAFDIWPKPDLIQVIGGFLCIIGVVVLDTAVEVDELGPGQQRLELVEDKTVLPLCLVSLAAARAVGLRSLTLLGLSFGGAGLDARMLRHGDVAEVGPDRHGAEGPIIARRLLRHGDRWRRGITQMVTNECFDCGLRRRQRREWPKCEKCCTQVPVESREARRVVECRPHHSLRRFDCGQIRQQRVILPGHSSGVRGAGGEPDIKRRIRLARGIDRQAFGQPQRLTIKTGTGNTLNRRSETAHEAKPVIGRLVGHSLQLDGRTAAKAPEQHSKPAADF